MVITNEKYAGPAYQGVLTDTLYGPGGKVMSNRSWDLDAVAPGDEITLTYTVAFDAYIAAGTYYNVARVTGVKSPTPGGSYPPMYPVEVRDEVAFASNGNVLGAATSTVAISNPTLTVVSNGTSCVPLLTISLRAGSGNRIEVMKLQSFLNTQGAKLPMTGFFGPMTTNAVKAFQKKFASEILAPVGLSTPTGLVYSSTIRKINRMVCGGIDPIVAGAASSSAAAGVKSTPTTPAKPKAPAKPKPKTSGSQGGGLLNAISGWFSKRP